MTTRTERWTPGTPCWADVMVADLEGCRRFYEAVMGWELVSSGGEYGDYYTASTGGRAAAGLMPVGEGMPPTWTLYFASDDVDAGAKAVDANGGTVVMAPTTIDGIGRMMAAVDPQGAPFGMWQADQFIGAEIYDEPGGLTWEDLRCADIEAARTFYANVFDFRFDDVDGAEDYQTFSRDDRPLGGIGPQWDAPRTMWIPYFGTTSTDAACSAATANGGTVTNQPQDTPWGRIATLEDPDGCRFSIVETPPTS